MAAVKPSGPVVDFCHKALSALCQIGYAVNTLLPSTEDGRRWRGWIDDALQQVGSSLSDLKRSLATRDPDADPDAAVRECERMADRLAEQCAACGLVTARCAEDGGHPCIVIWSEAAREHVGGMFLAAYNLGLEAAARDGGSGEDRR